LKNQATAFADRIKLHEQLKRELDFQNAIEDNLDQVVTLVQEEGNANDNLMGIHKNENLRMIEENTGALGTIEQSTQEMLETDEVLLFLLQYLKDSTINLILKIDTNVPIILSF